jgi:hypothetical protein
LAQDLCQHYAVWFEKAYFFLFLVWVKADAATLFCAGVDFGFDSCLLAFDATDGDVCSVFFFGAIQAS